MICLIWTSPVHYLSFSISCLFSHVPDISISFNPFKLQYSSKKIYYNKKCWTLHVRLVVVSLWCKSLGGGGLGGCHRCPLTSREKVVLWWLFFQNRTISVIACPLKNKLGVRAWTIWLQKRDALYSGFLDSEEKRSDIHRWARGVAYGLAPKLRAIPARALVLPCSPNLEGRIHLNFQFVSPESMIISFGFVDFWMCWCFTFWLWILYVCLYVGLPKNFLAETVRSFNSRWKGYRSGILLSGLLCLHIFFSWGSQWSYHN